MTATTPPVDELVGRHLRLRPLTRLDFPALRSAIGLPEVFAGGYGGGPAGLADDEEGFARWADRYYVSGPRGTSWAVLLEGGPSHGTLVGTSTLADLDLANESAHLGWTAFDPRLWGTPVNAESKLLLLGLAFDHGFGRVKIQADAANGRSRAAIEKLGAVFEGVLRRDKRRADGSWRDTAVYSVLRGEWPGVRAGVEARLDAWGDRPVVLGGSRAP